MSDIQAPTQDPENAGMAPIPAGEVRHGHFTIIKQDDDGVEYERIEFDNEYINTGSAVWLNALIGTGGITPFNNANSYIGVGDSSTAVDPTQTDLQASTNKLRKAMDATYPSLSGQVVTFRATFATGDANWVWNEVGLFNGSSGGAAMLCRKVQNLGTKASGTWTILYTITVP